MFVNVDTHAHIHTHTYTHTYGIQRPTYPISSPLGSGELKQYDIHDNINTERQQKYNVNYEHTRSVNYCKWPSFKQFGCYGN